MLLKVLVGPGQHGFYKAWTTRRCDVNHRIHAESFQMFRSIWLHDNAADDSPLPWRLTKPQIILLDARMARLCWSHYVEKLWYGGSSFWIKPNRLWKAKRKLMLLYYILPTQLRDQVPAVRVALSTFVWAMRRLLGQVYSFDSAKKHNILPGSRGIFKSNVPKINTDLTCGLVLVNGSLPEDHLNPGMHHFSHYGRYTFTHGLIRILWMCGFER